MTVAATIKQDRAWITGIALLLVSLFLFCFPTWAPLPLFTADGYFFLNYGIAVIYLVILLAGNRLRRGNNGLAHVFLLLILALISCYSLNRTLPIFEASATWWSILLVIGCLNYIPIFFFDRLPPILQNSICFIAGISLAAFLYLAGYLLPAYIIGGIAFLALGLSLHVFVPFLFVIYTLIFIRRAARTNRHIALFFFAGLFFAVAFTAQYAIRWHTHVHRMDHNRTAANAEAKNLPAWVAVAQDCSGSSIDETILKSGIVYTTSSNRDFDWMPRRLFNEQRKHDPLIVVASFFSGNSSLTDEERVKILECLYDSRHQAQRRLWNGDELATTNIATDVELWPQLHLSYTEENITVASTAPSTGWTASQEALYTFHLPEGAVVSSLSLWIDGKEQKGLLTSRQKADSAYTAIVGKYRRDPSVVHWQEGNTVVVRVYPVQTTESRRFKLGISAPLEKHDGKLVYHSIRFDGPPADNARSSVRILPMQSLIDPQLPPSFQSDSLGHARYPPSLLSTAAAAKAPIRQDGNYDPDWSLRFGDPGIESATFRFNGKQYTTDVYTPELETTGIRQVYLDLNSSWTSEEYESLLSSLAGMSVYAASDDTSLVTITGNNKKELFAAGSSRQFSLFPLFRITDPTHSLLISKSTPNSPALSDLNGSPFSRQLQEWLAKDGKVRFYDLGDELSPYWKALKEGGAFRFEKGDLYTLQSRLHHNTFLKDPTEAGLVVIEPAGLLIRRSDGPLNSQTVVPTITTNSAMAVPTNKNTTTDPTNTSNSSAAPTNNISSTAPDHLLRLFAYRQILQQLKGRLPGSYPDADWDTGAPPEQIAQEAGIVSPVSSLVVLEKRSDYDQFNIRESRNSLQNASLHDKGAVPEPGEWAILIDVFALFGCIRFHRLHQNNRSTTSQ